MVNPFIHIQNILDQSNEEAAARNVAEVNINHLMLGILEKGGEEIDDLIRNACFLKPAKVKSWLMKRLESLGEMLQNSGDANMTVHPDEMVRNVIRQATKEAFICDNTPIVEPKHLMLAILKDADSELVSYLTCKGTDYATIKDYLEVKKEIEMDRDIPDPTPEESQKFIDELNEAAAEEDWSTYPDPTQQPLPKDLLDLKDDENANSENDIEDKEDIVDNDAIVDDDDDSDTDLLDPDDDPLDLNSSSQDGMFQDSTQKNKDNMKAKKQPKTPVIDHFSRDLTDLATKGALSPVIGRDKEINRIMEILCRKKKNNPVLIGDPGVGKSAVVEGLALRIIDKKASPLLFGKRIVSLDITGMVAGTKYRGEFEERMKGLIQELKDNQDIIVFIDEIHTIVGAGNAEGTMDAANILKPALARGEIQCIGATTLDEYRKSIEKDGALERRFQKIIVDPTTPEETLEILKGIRNDYQQHHTVKYSDEVLEECVKLADRYINDRNFPDKAIDIIDEVGSRVHLKNARVPKSIENLEDQIKIIKKKKSEAVFQQNYEMAATYRDKLSFYETKLEAERKNWEQHDVAELIPVTTKDIAQVVSQMTGVPVEKMEKSEVNRLKNMSETIKDEVIGQDAAVDKVVKAIQRNRIGLRDPNHPIGVFMFLGPTGVGKTYLAKKLAEEIFGDSNSIIRIDMSEYSESFNTSRLLGAPPGYVGYNEGGQLTEKVRRKPYSIVLLDEIEKANGKIFNMLLQVLDEGRLTDGSGRLIDFRNTIIIMTSNAGTRQLKEFGRGIGFQAGGVSDATNMSESDKEYARSVIQKSLSKQFAPEFLNRLDEIITFDQLSIDSIKRIVNLELKPLAKRIEDMGYKLQISAKAKEFIATKGYDVQFGARPLKRAIQTYVEDGLCELMMEGKLKSGDTINISKSTKKDELCFRKNESKNENKNESRK